MFRKLPISCRANEFERYIGSTRWWLYIWHIWALTSFFFCNHNRTIELHWPRVNLNKTAAVAPPIGATRYFFEWCEYIVIRPYQRNSRRPRLPVRLTYPPFSSLSKTIGGSKFSAFCNDIYYLNIECGYILLNRLLDRHCCTFLWAWSRISSGEFHDQRYKNYAAQAHRIDYPAVILECKKDKKKVNQIGSCEKKIPSTLQFIALAKVRKQ